MQSMSCQLRMASGLSQIVTALRENKSLARSCDISSPPLPSISCSIKHEQQVCFHPPGEKSEELSDHDLHPGSRESCVAWSQRHSTPLPRRRSCLLNAFHFCFKNWGSSSISTLVPSRLPQPQTLPCKDKAFKKQN